MAWPDGRSRSDDDSGGTPVSCRTPATDRRLEDPLTVTATTGEPRTPGRFAALHPILLATYPVLFLWSQNLGETDPRQAVLPLAVLMVAAAVATWLLGRLLGDIRRGALIVTPTVVGATMYGHVANVLSGVGVPAIVQQLAWLALIGLGIVAAIRLGARSIGAVDRSLTRLAAILVAVALVLIVPFEVAAIAGRGSTDIAPTRGDTTTAQKRDVYWLIFDRYGSDRSLEMQYGIENDLTPWLRDEGFEVLADSHANYGRTALSVVTTLNATHLDDVSALPGPESSDLEPVYDLIRNSLVNRQFKALGYRTYHIGSWWEGTREDPSADVNLNVAGTSDFVDALFDESAIPPLMKRIGLGASVADRRTRHDVYNAHGLAALAGLRDEPGPKFVFAHILLPHPPFIYDRDGRFMTAAEEDALPDSEQFGRQLDYTNTRLREILGDLVALPEAERPIIIFQADEGPYPAGFAATPGSRAWTSATPDELEIKFGIMNAWYLPDGEDGLDLYPTMTSINTFPVLFRRYFGLDYEPLPDRIFSSTSWLLPYQLTDITMEIPSLR